MHACMIVDATCCLSVLGTHTAWVCFVLSDQLLLSRRIETIDETIDKTVDPSNVINHHADGDIAIAEVSALSTAFSTGSVASGALDALSSTAFSSSSTPCVLG